MKTDKTKKPGVFRYIEFGDVHLGHRLTSAASIIRNLDLLITDEVLKVVDMVIIAGDLFDRQLNNGDEVVHQINRWITQFMFRCAAYDVMLRIVEGTPSHDREQSRFFVEQKLNANIPVDLYYSKHLTIEYNERLDAHFLYVPDKHNPSTDVTLEEVRALLKERGLEQVDFAIMHGAFRYQLPSIVEEPTHDEAAYQALVKYQILIGHVHIMTIRGKIHAAGSFDRICHGDEIPKGMFDFSVQECGKTDVIFVENRRAKRYDTLNVHGLDTKELNVAIREKLKDLPRGSAVRLRCDPLDVANGDIDTYRMEYPKYEWSIIVEKTEKKKSTMNETLAKFDMSKFVDITKDSIEQLLVKELEQLTADPTTIGRCLQRLNEFL
jgi:hypothetical protein